MLKIKIRVGSMYINPIHVISITPQSERSCNITLTQWYGPLNVQESASSLLERMGKMNTIKVLED